jgi:cytochrome c peroxidase
MKKKHTQLLSKKTPHQPTQGERIMKKALFLSAVLTLAFLPLAWAGTSTGLDDMELLGRHLYKDKNMSLYQNLSCQVCHHPYAGFADRRNALNPETSVVSLGSDGVSTGGRNAPSSAYAGYSPALGLVDGEWVGGLFWDGRADGSVRGDPLAEQAQGPPLNPIEMAMPDKAAVVAVIENASYRNLFLQVFPDDDLSDVDRSYDNFARAVAAYERSVEVTSFSSKYDVAHDRFTDAESNGEILFESNCSVCHSTAAGFGAPAALFTNYGYANIGVPANPLVPLDAPDPGLGATVIDPDQNGKFKTPTLRNIAASPPYSHNGVFATLDAMVAFINDNGGVDPETGENLDARVGSLGLSDGELADIVVFLNTLTDGY